MQYFCLDKLFVLVEGLTKKRQLVSHIQNTLKMQVAEKSTMTEDALTPPKTVE